MRRVLLGTRMAQRLHSMSIKAWEAVQGAMKWIWESDKTDECSERTRGEREGQDDAGTRAGTNTRDVADSEAGLQGDVATDALRR